MWQPFRLDIVSDDEQSAFHLHPGTGGGAFPGRTSQSLSLSSVNEHSTANSINASGLKNPMAGRRARYTAIGIKNETFGSGPIDPSPHHHHQFNYCAQAQQQQYYHAGQLPGMAEELAAGMTGVPTSASPSSMLFNQQSLAASTASQKMQGRTEPSPFGGGDPQPSQQQLHQALSSPVLSGHEWPRQGKGPSLPRYTNSSWSGPLPQSGLGGAGDMEDMTSPLHMHVHRGQPHVHRGQPHVHRGQPWSLSPSSSRGAGDEVKMSRPQRHRGRNKRHHTQSGFGAMAAGIGEPFRPAGKRSAALAPILSSLKSPPGRPVSVAPAPAAVAPVACPGTLCQTGPTELYRLVSESPGRGGGGGSHGPMVSPRPPTDCWNAVMSRALSHPHEACFFDSNTGGNVYALHRLLRRTGETEACRPPYEVVEAVMNACPRAVTRKQPVMDEEDEKKEEDSETRIGGSDGMSEEEGDNDTMEGNGERMDHLHFNRNRNQPLIQNLEHVQQDRRHPQAQQERAPSGDGNQSDSASSQQDVSNRITNPDDVRYEYPLAIACECNQSGRVVRLVASAVRKTQPVYRSEVFRSLDYASLPNPVVRILLEEYAGCVLERGMDSEANEGDDDDCPLEKVLFWWDDPDMLGMAEDIAVYPDCDMKDDLRDLWEKLRMMLYAASMGTMAGYDDSRNSCEALHRAVKIAADGGIGDVRFPNDFRHAVWLLAKFIAREKAEMFRERDQSGSLPIHIAVSGRCLLLRDQEEHDNEEEEGALAAAQEDGPGAAAEGDELNRGVEAEAALEAVDPPNGLAGAAAAPQQEQPLQAGQPRPPAMDDGEEEEHQDEPDDEDEESMAEQGDVDHGEGAASQAYGMEIIRDLLALHPASVRLRDSRSGSLPLHLALRCNPGATELLQHLLDLHPLSVTMPDGNGRLPIHLALLRMSPMWEKILDLAPNAIEARDPMTRLFPFQVAALDSSSHSDTNLTAKSESRGDEQQADTDEEKALATLTVTYRLLRMSPCLASGLAKVKPRRQSKLERQIMASYKPRVTKLEEENESLRRQVEELQQKLWRLELVNKEGNMSNDKDRVMKKRKSMS